MLLLPQYISMLFVIISLHSTFFLLKIQKMSLCEASRVFFTSTLWSVPLGVCLVVDGGLAHLWAVGVADNRFAFNDVQLGNGIGVVATVALLAGAWCKWLLCYASSRCCQCLQWLRCRSRCCRLHGCFCRLCCRRRGEWWFRWFCRHDLGARLQNQRQWQHSGIFTWRHHVTASHVTAGTIATLATIPRV